MNHCSFLKKLPRSWRGAVFLILLASWVPCCPAADGNTKKTAKKQPSVQELIKALDSADENQSDLASEALFKIAQRSHLFHLLEAGKSKNPRVRAGIVQCLCAKPFYQVPYTDPPFYEIHDFLVQALKDKDPQVRRYAAACSWGHARMAPKLRDALIEAIKDPDKAGRSRYLSVSAYAVGTLGGLGTMARPVYRTIMDLAENGNVDEDMRVVALRAVGKLAAADEEMRAMLLGFLIRQLRQAKPEKYRAEAAAAIGVSREEAKAVLPALLKAFRSKSVKDRVVRDYIRGSVLCALEAIGPAAKAALPDVLPELADSRRSSTQREIILQYIVALKKEGKGALPTLQRIADDEREKMHFRLRVGKAIEKIKAAK